MEDNQQKRKSREQQRRAGAGERGKLCVYHSLLSVVKVVTSVIKLCPSLLSVGRHFVVSNPTAMFILQ